MLSAKYAKVLSEKMNNIGGIRGVIYRNIINAISSGKTSINITEQDYETLNWVLEDLVDIGYKVSRIPRYFRYRDVNEVKDYVYTIEW